VLGLGVPSLAVVPNRSAVIRFIRDIRVIRGSLLLFIRAFPRSSAVLCAVIRAHPRPLPAVHDPRLIRGP
jgi:hypothetical protein